jgi:hypothetical protein
MDENDERLMAEYGITTEAKVVFHYDGYRYERLADAANYARIQQSLPKGGGKTREVPGDER